MGLDVHARSVAAAAIDTVTGEVVQARLSASSEQVCGWLARLPGPVAVVYEAGPTGFDLYRDLTAAGVGCVVAAPSKLQRVAGDRVKTDARDALHLARLLLLGQITPVAIPSVEQESARDLVRAREDARGDLMAARHRLGKLLLRHSILYDGGTTWNATHDLWLRRQAGPRLVGRATRAAFESDYEAVLAIKARRDRLDAAIEQLAADSEFTPVVRRLGCLRGISTLTGFALAVEIGDWHRFTGNSIGTFVGLTPSEFSSGTCRVLGPITKTGNGHARRLLVEAAWHHRTRYVVGEPLRRRWDLASPAVRARADAGNRRLNHRWAVFTERRKKPTVTAVAVARELAGWCWSLATIDD